MESRINGVRLLSLDGGGIRGVSELFILKEIMERIQRIENLISTPPLSRYFDLIGGTSTGGLIAILLGRLGFTVAEAIAAYGALSELVFSETKSKIQDGMFKATKLKEAIQVILKDQPEAYMIEPEMPENYCKSFVCATPAHNMKRPRRFRTYESPKYKSYNCKIWEAARATSAAPRFFKRIAIGNPGYEEEYVDSALGCNNPIKEVLGEAEMLFGTKTLDCVVSIGTGRKEITGFSRPDGLQRIVPIDLIKVLRDITTDSENAADEIEERFSHTPGVYHRLNVDQGLGTISLNEWEQLHRVKTNTETWLQKPDIDARIDEIVKSLTKKTENLPVPVPSLSGREILGFPHHNGSQGQRSKAPFMVPFRRDNDFVDRGDILERVDQILSEPAGRVAFFGLGGVGKSQLAIEYAHRVRSSSPETSIFWIHARDHHQFEEGYRLIASRLKLPGADDPQTMIVPLVSDWLSIEENGRWLLILDNCDNPDVFSGHGSGENIRFSNYIPQTDNGTVLITSRRRDASRILVFDYKNIIEIKPMEPDDGMKLLKTKLASNGPDEASRELLRVLGYMPLAITQAAAYINHGAPRMSIEKYLKNFLKGGQHAMDLLGRDQKDIRRPEDAKNAILTTLEMSFEQIRKSRPSAADLLSLLGYFDRQLVPTSLLRNKYNEADASSEKDSDDEHSDLEPELDLEDGNIYRKSDDDDSWGIPSDDEGTDSNGEEGDNNRRILTNVERRKTANRDLTDDLASEGDFDLEFGEDCAMLRDYCLIDISEGEGENLFVSMHRLVQLAIKDWVHERQETVKWQIKALSRVSEEFPASEYEEWPKCQSLLLHARTVLEYHPSGILVLSDLLTPVSRTFWIKRANLLSNVARFLEVQRGVWKKAEELYREAFDIRSKLLGEDHDDTLVSKHHLGHTYIKQSRWIEAEDLYRTLKTQRERLEPINEPELIRATNGLAVSLFYECKLEEAEIYMTIVYEYKQATLGNSHLETLKAKDNLGEVQFMQGKTSQAVVTLLDVVETAEQVLGKQHPKTLDFINSLAWALVKHEDFDSAKLWGATILQRAEESLGKDHPTTLEGRYQYGEALRLSGILKEAEHVHKEGVRRREKVLGKHHSHTLDSRAGLAWTYLQQGRYDEAFKLSEQTLASREKYLGKEHPDSFRSAYLHARLLQLQQKFEKAEIFYVKACAGLKLTLKSKNPETVKALKDYRSMMDAIAGKETGATYDFLCG